MNAAARLATWIADSKIEDQHFDLKQSVAIATRGERKELLKDLTGMGNGGGGTVAFGLAERVSGSDAATDHVVELTDRTLPSRVTDVIADGIRPTLRWHADIVDQPGGGYVLIIDVERSPLGPYMVDAYGDHRYWRRSQTSTLPMDERLVHDLYAEAVRWEAQRTALWTELSLPLEPTWSARPWLTATGIPEYLTGEPFDPARCQPSQLAFNRSNTEHARIAGLDQLPERLAVWADGFVAMGNAERDHGSYPPAAQAVVRVHRNASLGLGVHLATPYRLDAVRALNAQLDYMSELWEGAGIGRVELRIEISRLGRGASNDPIGPFPVAPPVPSTTSPRVQLAEVVHVAELRSASIRHRLLRRFADRLANCFGVERERVGFEVGALHDSQGPAGGWGALAWIHRDGSFTQQDLLVGHTGAVRPPSDLRTVGWWDDGVLSDLAGNAVAALEFAVADGLPSDFVPLALHRSDDLEPDTWEPEAWGDDLVRPPMTGRWSDQTFVELVRANP